MDRVELIDLVKAMIKSGETAEGIVDAVIETLTPGDGDDCPVCGICP